MGGQVGSFHEPGRQISLTRAPTGQQQIEAVDPAIGPGERGHDARIVRAAVSVDAGLDEPAVGNVVGDRQRSMTGERDAPGARGAPAATRRPRVESVPPPPR